MAAVLLLASKGGDLILPYEYVKYLSQHFWLLSDDLRASFKAQVD
jgi:hypothetical protein